jgi:hypothetical protein
MTRFCQLQFHRATVSVDIVGHEVTVDHALRRTVFLLEDLLRLGRQVLAEETASV